MFEFYSVTLDAGTVTNKHGLFRAANPSISHEHIFLGSEVMSTSWGTEEYNEWGRKMIKNHYKLIAFVGDGLRAGIAGLAHFKPTGICHEFNSMVLFIPCHNHIINKAFEHAISSCAELNTVVTMIDDLSVLLRKPSAQKNRIKIPNIPKTRWLYSYDVALWIIKRKKEINDALSNMMQSNSSLFSSPKFSVFKNGVPAMLYDFITATKPMKVLQLAYENERVGLPFVYPFYMNAMNELQFRMDKRNDTVKNIAKSLAKHLAFEFKEKTRIPILALAFALTPAGKRYINGARFDGLFKPYIDLLVMELMTVRQSLMKQ